MTGGKSGDNINLGVIGLEGQEQQGLGSRMPTAKKPIAALSQQGSNTLVQPTSFPVFSCLDKGDRHILERITKPREKIRFSTATNAFQARDDSCSLLWHGISFLIHDRSPRGTPPIHRVPSQYR